MSYFQCPSDGVQYDLFGRGGGGREAKRLGVPLLGEIPIEVALREGVMSDVRQRNLDRKPFPARHLLRYQVRLEVWWIKRKWLINKT